MNNIHRHSRAPVCVCMFNYAKGGGEVCGGEGRGGEGRRGDGYGCIGNTSNEAFSKDEITSFAQRPRVAELVRRQEKREVKEL